MYSRHMAEVVVVNMFASHMWTGATVPIVFTSDDAPDSWMQAVARELQVSDTAFLDERSGMMRTWTDDGEVDYSVRGALACAYVLKERGNTDEQVTIETRARTFSVEVGEWCATPLPVQKVREDSDSASLGDRLGLSPRFAGRTDQDLVLELDSEEAVAAVRPDPEALNAIEDARGVVVTAPASNPGYDFVSRFFAVYFDECEDTVTASAHALLGPYWSGRLSKEVLVGRQASKRGGLVRTDVSSGAEVSIGGRAITVLRGDIAGDAPAT